MAIREFDYTKNWTDPNDFPTYEPDETKVRADMQVLYDEIKDFLNGPLREDIATTYATNAAFNQLVQGVSPDLTSTIAALEQM